MAASIPSPSNNILAQPQEDCVQLAIEAITIAGYEPNSNVHLSICKATGAYQVPCSTLRNCLNGAKAHANQHALSPAKEEILVEWAKVMGHQGVPLTLHTCYICFQNLREGTCGQRGFLTQHAGNLRVKATTSLKKCHTKALNQSAVEGFYSILEETVKEFNIEPNHLWNMDEKGVQLGVGAKVAAIIDHD